MIITNISNIPGREISEVLGIVQGNVVGTKKIEAPILEALKNVFASALSWGPKIVTGQTLGLPGGDAATEKKQAVQTRSG